MTSKEANWDRALCGDFGPLVHSWPSAAPEERASIDALLSLVSERRPPSVKEVTSLGARRALRLLSLRAVLRADPEELSAIQRAQESLGRADDARLSSRWHRLFAGGHTTDTAGRAEDAATRIESAAVSALELLGAGDTIAAVDQARRAALMARSQGYVLHELLASIVLARCRRFEGRPHLATRILATIAEVAPPAWRGWVRYEQRLAGEQETIDPSADGFDPYVRLNQLLAGAASGHRGLIDEACEGAPCWASAELNLLAESLDPARAPNSSPRHWIEGTGVDCPKELTGLCIPDVGAAGESSPVVLLVRPGQAARRMLALGAPLAGAVAPDAFELSQSRTLATIAHLAVEPALDRAALFKRVYGFPYLADRHAGTLRVLLHRVRRALPPILELDEHDRLVVRDRALLPDPRVVFDQQTLVLRHLARHAGRASAQEIADELGVSARTVQTTLRGLLDDGTCSSVREGRRIEYRLEDTTLSEPTVSRLHPRGLTRLNEI